MQVGWHFGSDFEYLIYRKRTGKASRTIFYLRSNGKRIAVMHAINYLCCYILHRV